MNPQGEPLVRTLLRRLVLRQLRHVLVQQVGQRLGVGQQLLVRRGELLVLLVPVLAQLPFGMKDAPEEEEEEEVGSSQWMQL